MKSLLWVALALLLLAPGCKKSEKKRAPDKDGPPPISQKEEKRGRDACVDFKKRVCKCAGENPDNAFLKDQCSMADSRLSAIDLGVRISAADNSSSDDRSAAISAARKVAQACIERSAQLAVGCEHMKPAAPPAESANQP